MVKPIERVFDLLFKPDVPESPDIFESRIEGDFEGWSGNTLFTLINGQIWQQVSCSLVRHHACSPSVVIYLSGVGYKMKVDGVDETICVRRLR